MKREIIQFINRLIKEQISDIIKMAFEQNYSFSYAKNDVNFTLTVEIEEEIFTILYYYDKVFDIDVFNAIDDLYKKLSIKF